MLVQMILESLGYLHLECRVIHIDLKPDNLMVKPQDPWLLEKDARDEYDNPLPQKHLDDRTPYLSGNNYGPFHRMPRAVRITDSDLAVCGDVEQSGPISAETYHAPEVILDIGNSCSADIWNFGLLLWDLLEGKKRFDVHYGADAEYDEEAHFVHMTALLGPLPPTMHKGRRVSMFYASEGRFQKPAAAPDSFTFENTIASINGEEKGRFVAFVRRMICWNPEERSTAKELLQDPWLESNWPQVSIVDRQDRSRFMNPDPSNKPHAIH